MIGKGMLSAAVSLVTVLFTVAAWAESSFKADSITGSRPPADQRATTGSLPHQMTENEPLSGGYLDDGLYDDDWFFDYYDVQPPEPSGQGQVSSLLKEYQADQLYEDVRSSGLFDF